MFDEIPDSGAAAHRAGLTIADCPYLPGDPAGRAWRESWIHAEAASRAAAGTYGASDEEYRAAGLTPPDRRFEHFAPRVVMAMPSPDAWQRAAAAAMRQVHAMGQAFVVQTRRGFQAVDFTIDDVKYFTGVLYPPMDEDTARRLLGLDEPATSTTTPAVPADWASMDRDELVAPARAVVSPEPTLRRLLTGSKAAPPAGPQLPTSKALERILSEQRRGDQARRWER